MDQDRSYYVYLLFRRNPIGPIYVGKGCNRSARLERHCRDSHNAQVNRVRAKEGGEPLPGVILAEGLTEDEAFALEVLWIRTIGRRDQNSGPLLNGTNGGEGVVGHKRTKAQREAMSVARKGRPVSPGLGAKVSAALTGRPKTAAHAIAAADAKRGVKLGPMAKDQKEAWLEGQRRRRAREAIETQDDPLSIKRRLHNKTWTRKGRSVENVISTYLAGKSTAEIGREVGLHKSTIRTCLWLNGVELRPLNEAAKLRSKTFTPFKKAA